MALLNRSLHPLSAPLFPLNEIKAYPPKLCGLKPMTTSTEREQYGGNKRSSVFSLQPTTDTPMNDGWIDADTDDNKLSNSTTDDSCSFLLWVVKSTSR